VSHRLVNIIPARIRAAGEEQVRETIRLGIERARVYGVTGKRDVCKYIDLIIVFERSFDADPRYPWAGQILGKPGDPSTKMRSALEAGQSHLRKA
jgi:hypothetical protein